MSNAPTRRTRTLALGVTAAAALAGLAGCDSAGEQVADTISEQVGEAIGLEEPDTTCPEDAEAGEGNEFDCEIEVEGQELTATVTFTSDDRFDFVFNGDVFDKEVLEEQIAAEAEAVVGSTVTFDCGGETMVVIPADDTIECEGEADDGTTGTAEVGLDDTGAPELVDLRQD